MTEFEIREYFISKLFVILVYLKLHLCIILAFKKCLLQILDAETLNILFSYPIHDTVTGKASELCLNQLRF